MKKSFSVATATGALIGAIFLLGFTDLYAQQLAFPSAEGFGRFTVGGRGGAVCHVIDTGTDGSGSVVDATNKIYEGDVVYCVSRVNGPRMIVFQTSGRINSPYIFARDSRSGGDDYYTMACQSAPDPGVYFTGTFLLDQSQLIVRHCRFRSTGTDGFASLQVNEGPTNSGDIAVKDVIIDHSSVTYHTDETFNMAMPNGHYPCIYNNNRTSCPERVTLQWSIVAEGLGTIQGDDDSSRCFFTVGAYEFSAINNIVANCSRRFPALSDGETELINNIWYNWGSSNDHTGYFGAYWDISHYSWIGNYFYQGPDSDNDGLKWEDFTTNSAFPANMTVFLDGNLHTGRRPTDTGPETLIFSKIEYSGWASRMISQPASGWIQPGDATVTTANQALLDVLEDEGAGPFMPSFDAVDAANRADVASGGTLGNIPLNLADTHAGWPSFAVNPRGNCANGYGGTDDDCDGMPDTWETANGLDKDDASDHDDIASNGYTNLENYLNELAGDVVPGVSSPDDHSPLPPSNVTITQ